MNRDLFDLLKANSLLEQLPEMLRELWNRTMATPEEAMDSRAMIAKEAVQVIMKMEALESAGIATETPKSSRTSRSKKDKPWYRCAYHLKIR